jgi:uncharacterized protein
MPHTIWFVPLGFAAGAFGTLIGVGGGFLLVPVLLLLHPTAGAGEITAVALTVVFFNALSGTIAYARLKRIDYRAGLIFAAAGTPGAIAGAFATPYIPRAVFDPVFGAVMILVAAYLVMRMMRERRFAHAETAAGLGMESVAARGPRRMRLGVIISFFVGFISSLLGLGGGIIHVPALISVLGFSVHAATATSHFMLAIMTFQSAAVHAAQGSLAGRVAETVLLAAGAVIGAQVGARFSGRVKGRWIIAGLAAALGMAGARLVFEVLR